MKEVKELVLHYRSLGPERHKSFESETKDIHPGAFFCLPLLRWSEEVVVSQDYGSAGCLCVHNEILQLAV